mmetsp:Transcript_74990/g.211888  ORF Transcript_74990/g.211888 Transcript_74990/m.211888 type:complete len:233 (+) Transcript_74990:2609-3307(+)
MYSSGVHLVNSLRWCMCCCAMYARRRLRCFVSSPGAIFASRTTGWSSPARSAISVDFPAPFLPTTATRLLNVSRTVTSLITGPWASSYWNDALLSVSTGLLCVTPTIFSGMGKVIRLSSAAGGASPGLKPAPAAPGLIKAAAPPPAMLDSLMISSTRRASCSSPFSALSLKAPKFPGWYASFPSEVKWTMSVQTSSRNSGSWDTIMAVPPARPPMQVVLMNFTSHLCAVVSR